MKKQIIVITENPLNVEVVSAEVNIGVVIVVVINSELVEARVFAPGGVLNAEIPGVAIRLESSIEVLSKVATVAVGAHEITLAITSERNVGCHVVCVEVLESSEIYQTEVVLLDLAMSDDLVTGSIEQSCGSVTIVVSELPSIPVVPN